MSEQPDTILIVDDDPEVRSLLREQVLAAPAFRVLEAKDAPDALLLTTQQRPDLIVLDLEMPGLSGNDLLVALRAQGHPGPLIVMGGGDKQRAVVEAFRMGATDYLTKPLRETEVLTAVERGLAEVRLRRERDGLLAQLQTANRQLEARVKELTTLYTIGDSVTALRDLESVFTRVLDGVLALTGADYALLLLRDDASGQLVLRAGKNLPLTMLDRVGGPVQDPLADLVMTSREPLVVAGDGLRRFKTARDLRAAAYAPLIVQQAAIGVLAAANQQTQAPFTEMQGRLLHSLANYATIAIVSTRLSFMLGQRTQQVRALAARLSQPLAALDQELLTLAQNHGALGTAALDQRLRAARQVLQQVLVQLAGLGQPHS